MSVPRGCSIVAKPRYLVSRCRGESKRLPTAERILVRAANLLCFFIWCSQLIGCCSVYFDRELDTATSACLVDGLNANIRAYSRRTTFGTPLLLEYQKQSAPYGLTIEFTDVNQSFDLIEVTEIDVVYSDGDVIQKSMLWQRNIHHSKASGPVASDVAFYETIQDVLERHSDATVTMKGRLTTSNGEIVKFAAPVSFKAKSKFYVVLFPLNGV